MNFSFSPYTPRVKPLNYDALSLKAGCEADSGNDFFDVLAFDQVCVAPHNADNYGFTEPDTVSYARGPRDAGDTHKPFTTGWAAWVATAGIRIGKLSYVVPPANTEGVASALYPTTKPTKLSIAFDRFALLHMAIQKTSTTVEVKWYSDNAGTVATASWTGISCVLFFPGLSAPREEGSSVVAYYLRADRPNVLFARFADEGYATERTVMPAMRVNLTRLIGITALPDFRAALRAVDALGRDVTLYTPAYSVLVREAATLATSFESGLVFNAAVPAPDQAENATLAISFATGLVFDATVAAALPADGGELNIEFDSGEVSTA